MLKPKIAFIAERYWPSRGGIEEAIRLTIELVSDVYESSVITQIPHDRRLGLFGRTAGLPKWTPYHDPYHTPVLPLLPSVTGRAVLLPVMLRHFPGMRRYFSRWMHERFYLCYYAAFASFLEDLLAPFSLSVSYSGDYLGILGQQICARMGIPHIFISSVHPGGWDDSPLALRAYRASKGIATNTEFAKKYFIGQGVAEEKVCVIPRPIREFAVSDAKKYRLANAIQGPMVLFIGRRDPHKGFPLLLKSFAKVRQKFPTASLVALGPGERTEILPPGCADLGIVSDEEKAMALCACDVFCLPSMSESLGMVYLEAWYAGKPVIACGTPETREFISHGKEGLLTEPNEDSLTEALVSVISNPERGKALGEAGKNKYMEQYSNTVLKNKLISWFQRQGI